MTKRPLETENPLIITFLQRLNVARRHQATYPPEHPAIVESINNTLAVLQDFFLSSPLISLGIGPDSVYFEQLKFTDEHSAVAEFCRFFTHLGIATVNFQKGLTTDELMRFNQLLRSNRNDIESFGGFSSILEDQRIVHIQVIAIDYDAFQAKELGNNTNNEESDLWGNFLFGLSRGILAFDSDNDQRLSDLAHSLNQLQSQPSANDHANLTEFITHSMYAERSNSQQIKAGQRLNQLLQQLNPRTREYFLSHIVNALDKNPQPAENILAGISSQYINASLASLSQQKQQVSSRLVNLLELFSDNNSESQRKRHSGAALSADVIKARLDELFREEQQETYLPEQYQSALNDVFSKKVSPDLIPDNVKTELRYLLEHQSIEDHFSQIILKLLENPLTKEQELAIQEQLLELTKYYLDTGRFKKLTSIYISWNQHLNSGDANLDIFAEKVIAAHSQKSFIAETLDGFNIWEAEKHIELTHYVQTVGEHYVAPVIERLGLAPSKEERMHWLHILKKISSNTQQTIISALADERWYLIRNLLIALREQPNQATLKASLPFCNHDHPMVRIEAIGNLLLTNPVPANRYLRQELQSDDPWTREAAVKIASLSKDPEVLSTLHALVQTPAASDIELQLQMTTIRTLGKIANPESVIVFRRLLAKKGLFLSPRIKALQQEIIQVLPYFSGPGSKKLIQELAGGKFKELMQTALSNAQQESHEAT